MNGDHDPIEIAMWMVIAFVVTILVLGVIYITGG